MSGIIEGSTDIDGKRITIRTQVTVTDAPDGHQCPPGFHWDDSRNECIENPPPPVGQDPGLPPSGEAQEKGANPDPATWTAVPMKDDPTLFKVVDGATINVAHKFASSIDANQYIAHFLWVKNNPNPPPPPPPPPHTCEPGFHWSDTEGKCVPDNGPPTGQFPYAAKPGGYKQTKIDTQQGDCEGDGKRFNIANKKDVINYHAYWFMTLIKEVTSSCTDKPWWSPKLGSHGSSGEPSYLIEASTFWKGGLKGVRMEGPHGTYKSYPDTAVKAMKDVPKMPVGKQIGVYVANWLTKDGKNYITQFFYDFVNGGKGPWVLYCTVMDKPEGVISGKKPLEGTAGHYTLVGDPSNCKSTMRGNGMSATLQGGAVEEIEVPDTIIQGPTSASQSLGHSFLKAHEEEDDCTIEG